MDYIGVARRILLLWDRRVLELVEMENRIFFYVSCFLEIVDGFYWTFFEVYGPVKNRKREFFWEELGSIRGFWDDL